MSHGPVRKPCSAVGDHGAAAFAVVRLEDRSTAIRQLVDQALRDLSKREALQAYQQGRLTLRELAGTLRLDVWAA